MADFMNLQVSFGNFGPYKLLAVLLQCTSAHMYSIMEIHLAKKMTKTSLQYAKTIQALYFSHKRESALCTQIIQHCYHYYVCIYS